MIYEQDIRIASSRVLFEKKLLKIFLSNALVYTFPPILRYGLFLYKI